MRTVQDIIAEHKKVMAEDPKEAIGIKKVSLSVVPLTPLLEVALAFLEGARKYGKYNYKYTKLKASVYFDAAIRHLFSFWEGEDIDPDSGISHLSKAMACIIILREAQMRENLNDDRPPSAPEGWMTKLNEATAKEGK